MLFHILFSAANDSGSPSRCPAHRRTPQRHMIQPFILWESSERELSRTLTRPVRFSLMIQESVKKINSLFHFLLHLAFPSSTMSPKQNISHLMIILQSLERRRFRFPAAFYLIFIVWKILAFITSSYIAGVFRNNAGYCSEPERKMVL